MQYFMNDKDVPEIEMASPKNESDIIQECTLRDVSARSQSVARAAVREDEDSIEIIQPRNRQRQRKNKSVLRQRDLTPEEIAAKQKDREKWVIDRRILRRAIIRETFLNMGLEEEVFKDNYLMCLSDEHLDKMNNEQFQTMLDAQKNVYDVLRQANLINKIQFRLNASERNSQQSEIPQQMASQQSVSMNDYNTFDNQIPIPVVNQQVTQPPITDLKLVHSEHTDSDPILIGGGDKLTVPEIRMPNTTPQQNNAPEQQPSFAPTSLTTPPTQSFDMRNNLLQPKPILQLTDRTKDMLKQMEQQHSKTLDSQEQSQSPKEKKMKKRKGLILNKRQSTMSPMKDRKAELKKKEEAEKRKKKRELKEKKQKSQSSAAKLKLGGKVKIPANLGFWGRLYNNLMNADQKKTNENLSYKQLHKHIVTLHPTDPETFEKLEIEDSITVSNYGLKLLDAIGCLAFMNLVKFIMKSCKSLFQKKKPKLYIKPDTMKDVPDSDSDSEANDTFKGLSSASIYLGEGAVMYLQMMKTFAVLFFMLTILNIPLFYMYASMTEGNNYTNLNDVFQYFTLGNIAKGNKVCGQSFIDYLTSSAIYPQDEIPTVENVQEQAVAGLSGEGSFLYPDTLDQPDPIIHHFPLSLKTHPKIELNCKSKGSYILGYQHLGFLYMLDSETDKFSSASQMCSRVENPLEKHHKQNEVTDLVLKELIKAKHNESVLNPDLQPSITNFNVDSHCNHETVFRTQEDKQFFDEFFKNECIYKSKCVFDTESMSYKDPKTNVTKTGKFSEMISDSCYNRIYNVKISSIEFIMVAACTNDYVQLPFGEDVQLHIHYLGTIAVISDILSILLTYYIFNKLKLINQEYQEIMDNNIIKMSEFAIRINNIKLDKTTQDARILKMKLWLHFTKILRRFQTEDNKMEVADVQLSNSSAPKYFLLMKMEEFQSQINMYTTKLQSDVIDYKEKSKCQKALNKLTDKIKRFTDKYEAILDKEDNQTNRPVIHISKHSFMFSIDYIWIVFKHNQTPKTVAKIFEQQHPVALCVKTMFCIKDEINDEAVFGDQQLMIEAQPLEPDQILWRNLKYTKSDQQIRSFLVFLISIVVAVVSITITLFFIGQNKRLKKYDVDCSEISLDVESVHRDQTQSMYQKIQMSGDEKMDVELSDSMLCFCQVQTAGGMQPWYASNKPFAPVDPDYKEKINYCAQYVLIVLNKEMVSGIKQLSMVIINAFISMIFQILGKFQMKHTTIEQALSSFQYIINLEYFNMCIIILLQSFDPTGTAYSIMGQDPKTAIVYEGFNSAWYLTIGQKLCFTIFMTAILSNFGELKKMLESFLERFSDRGYKINIKKDLEDEDDDEPNSKMQTQDDLEDLYTGLIFKGEKAYSRMMSIVMVCLSYSSGMPIIYFVGFMYFLLTFLVNKVMLIKFYQKTNTLSRVIPNYSVKFLNIAIFIHMVFGCVMFTNSTLFEYKDLPEYDLPRIDFLFDNELGKMMGKRVIYFHQQLYLLFFVLSLCLFFGGKFVGGLIILILEQIQQFTMFVCQKILLFLKFLWALCQKLFWIFARKFCLKQVEAVERKIAEQLKQAEEKRRDFLLADKIDQLWETYDNDRSGSLDKDEAREFITDLLNQIDQGDNFNEDFFEIVFKKFDVDQSGTVEKDEMLHLIKILLYGESCDEPDHKHYEHQHRHSNENSKTYEMEKLISQQSIQSNVDKEIGDIFKNQQNGELDDQTEKNSDLSEDQQIYPNEAHQEYNLAPQQKQSVPKLKITPQKLDEYEGGQQRSDSKKQEQNEEDSEQEEAGKGLNDKKIIAEIKDKIQTNIDKAEKKNDKLGVFQAGVLKGAFESEIMSPEEKARQEKMMARFKEQILRPYVSENIYVDLNVENLIRMFEKARKELDDINMYFNIRNTSDRKNVLTPPMNRRVKKHELRILFEELCYTSKLTFKEVISYLNMLDQRTTDVQDAINNHMELIKSAIYKNKEDRIERQNKKYNEEKGKTQAAEKKSGKGGATSSRSQGSNMVSNRMNSNTKSAKKADEDREGEIARQIELNIIKEQLQNDPDLQFDNPYIYTYEKKLMMLDKFEEDLIKNDRAKKENRRGIQTICRMQGSIAQSYFILDQIDFKVARKIYYGHCKAGEAQQVEKDDGEKGQLGIYKSKVDIHQQGGHEHDIMKEKYEKNTGKIDIIFEQIEKEDDQESEERYNQSRAQKIKDRQKSIGGDIAVSKKEPGLNLQDVEIL